MQIKIDFTRKFTKGNLIGLEHSDSIVFPNRKSANAWVDGIYTNSGNGSLDYKIESYKLQEVR